MYLKDIPFNIRAENVRTEIIKEVTQKGYLEILTNDDRKWDIQLHRILEQFKQKGIDGVEITCQYHVEFYDWMFTKSKKDGE